MIITVDRKYKKDTYTISNLYINGVWFCNVLEDKDRGLKQTDSLSTIKAKKVYSETAIPSGTYKVAMNVISPKYSASTWYKNLTKGYMPRLLNVPGFDGILIHCGTTALDSAGCLLVGRNTIKGKITQSRETFSKLYKLMKSADDKKEQIQIIIK